MSGIGAPAVPSNAGADQPLDVERLSADDTAQRTADRFIGASIEAQRLRAARQARPEPGRCSNCGDACLPAAVYCDEACRADHERREAVQARKRKPLG